MNRNSIRPKSVSISAGMLAAVLFVSLGATMIWAQATAQIIGSVKDQTGAVLPGVEVTATQTATGAKRTAVTDETGSYTLQNLAIGPYTIEFCRGIISGIVTLYCRGARRWRQ